MSFIQRHFKQNKRMNDKYIVRYDIQENTLDLTENMFTREDYLLSSIASSLIFDVDKDVLTENVKDNDLINAYRNLHEIRKIFIEKVRQPLDGEIGYIYPKLDGYESSPLNDYRNLIIITFELINKDANFRLFNRDSISLQDQEKALGTIYNILKDTFFVTEDYRPSGERRRLIVKEIIDLPKNRSGINLLYRYPYNREDNYEDRDGLSVAYEIIEGHSDENQYSDSIDNTPSNQEATDDSLGRAEENKPDEPKYKVVDEQQIITDSEHTDNDRNTSEKIKKLIAKLKEEDNNKEKDNNPEENS